MVAKSIQEQLRDLRVQQILEAAGEVFASSGFHAAKMKDVAAWAGVSNGTVYNYFPSKESLLTALLHRLNESESRESHFAEGLALGDFRAFFRAYLQHRWSFLERHLSLFRAVLPELLRDGELQETYREEVLGPSFAMSEMFLQKMMDAGELLPTDASSLSRLLAGQLLGLLVLRLLGDAVVVRDEMIDVVVDTLLRGLGWSAGTTQKE